MDGYHFIRSGHFPIGLVFFNNRQVAPTSGVMTGAASASHGKSWTTAEAERRTYCMLPITLSHNINIYSLGTLKLMGGISPA